MTILRRLRNILPVSWGQKDHASAANSGIEAELDFKSSEALTLGVEFELALLDRETLKPVSIGEDVIAAANMPNIKKELFRHMVEVTTDICRTADEAQTQLGDALRRVVSLADERGALVVGSGRPPTLLVSECDRVEDARYAYLSEQRKIINDRFGTLGMHVHVGMTSAQACVRFHNFYSHFIPHFMALGASSPFEEREMTGLASARALITESLPVGGIPYYYRSWQEYVELCQAMVKAGSIRTLKDLWWDIRPAPRFGTLEIRVCDQPATLQQGIAIVAFVHALGKWFAEHQDWLDEMPRPQSWRLRENKWRAIRYGLDAEFISNNQGDTRPIREDIEIWLQRLTPYIKELGYEKHMENIRNIMVRGNSAQRQQQLFAAGQSVEEITRFLARELNAMKPLHDEVGGIVAKAAAVVTAPAEPVTTTTGASGEAVLRPLVEAA